MPHKASTKDVMDRGLLCLTLVMRFFGLAADINQPRHQFAYPRDPDSPGCLIPAGCSPGSEMRRNSGERGSFIKTSLPVPAQHIDVHWAILTKVDDEPGLTRNPLEKHSLVLLHEVFEPAWNVVCILFARRAVLGGRYCPFRD